MRLPLLLVRSLLIRVWNAPDVKKELSETPSRLLTKKANLKEALLRTNLAHALQLKILHSFHLGYIYKVSFWKKWTQKRFRPANQTKGSEVWRAPFLLANKADTPFKMRPRTPDSFPESLRTPLLLVCRGYFASWDISCQLQSSENIFQNYMHNSFGMECRGFGGFHPHQIGRATLMHIRPLESPPNSEPHPPPPEINLNLAFCHCSKRIWRKGPKTLIRDSFWGKMHRIRILILVCIWAWGSELLVFPFPLFAECLQHVLVHSGPASSAPGSLHGSLPGSLPVPSMSKAEYTKWCDFLRARLSARKLFTTHFQEFLGRGCCYKRASVFSRSIYSGSGKGSFGKGISSRSTLIEIHQNRSNLLITD